MKKNKKDKDEQDMLFQEPVSTSGNKLDDLERGGEVVITRNVLNDDDYTYENRNYHRVRNYSFSRS